MATVTQQPANGMDVRGFAWLLVYVEEVNMTTREAIVVDQFGKRRTLRADYRRGKGPLPVVGEQWVIDKTLGSWTFSSVVIAKPPTITGATGGNAAIISLLGELQTAGLVIDNTDHSGGGGGGTGTHDHMGTGVNSTIVAGLLDADAPTAAGDETFAGGDGASAFGWGSVVIGKGSSDQSSDSAKNVILGYGDNVYGENNIFIVEDNGQLGSLADGVFDRGNIVIATSYYGGGVYKVGLGYDNVLREVDSSILIGSESWGMGLPNCDAATTIAETPYFGAASQLIQITPTTDGTRTWGKKNVNINADDYSADNFVIGQGLVSVGNNWIARERIGPSGINFDGTNVYEDIYDSFAFGTRNNFVSGDESGVIGIGGGTSRASHMVLQSAGGLTFGGIVEFATEVSVAIWDGVSGPRTIHSSNLYQGSVLPLRTTPGNVTVILDDITSSAGVGILAYDEGDYPAGNNYNTGKAQGTFFIIKKVSSDAHTVIVQPASGTIDNAASVILTSQWDYVVVLALRYRTNDASYPTPTTWASSWTVLGGVIGGVPIGASGGGGSDTGSDINYVTADPSGAPAAGMEAQFNKTNNYLWIWNPDVTAWKSVELA